MLAICWPFHATVIPTEPAAEKLPATATPLAHRKGLNVKSVWFNLILLNFISLGAFEISYNQPNSVPYMFPAFLLCCLTLTPRNGLLPYESRKPIDEKKKPIKILPATYSRCSPANTNGKRRAIHLSLAFGMMFVVFYLTCVPFVAMELASLSNKDEVYNHGKLNNNLNCVYMPREDLNLEYHLTKLLPMLSFVTSPVITLFTKYCHRALPRRFAQFLIMPDDTRRSMP